MTINCFVFVVVVAAVVVAVVAVDFRGYLFWISSLRMMLLERGYC